MSENSRCQYISVSAENKLASTKVIEYIFSYKVVAKRVCCHIGVGFYILNIDCVMYVQCYSRNSLLKCREIFHKNAVDITDVLRIQNVNNNRDWILDRRFS